MLESHKELFEKKKARVITVNLDEPTHVKGVKGFSGQQGFTFPIILNKTETEAFKIDEVYNVMGTPTSYLIDASGTILEAHYGPLSPEELTTALGQLPTAE